MAKAAGAGKELGCVYGLKGLLALGKGRLREALTAAEKAVVLNPREASGWYVRPVRLERAAPGALADLQKAAELSRKDADVLQALAEAEWQAGQAEPARQTLREAIKLRPNDKALAELLKEPESMTGRRP